MNNLPLQPLVWKDLSHGDVCVVRVDTPMYDYAIVDDSKAFKVGYYNLHSPIKYATGFATIEEAKQWAWKHYNEKMQPYVKPDSITDIANWFKAAKPEPTDKDRLTQLGCHFEEVDEMIAAIIPNVSSERRVSADYLAKEYKESNESEKANKAYFETCVHNIELLDALCDQIVTATGVAYMMGFDIQGALKEVIRSNNSKMVDGKFEFDDNGKITKPDSYSEPDLTPFISTMQNMHKGE